jgi:hypothetical protein
VAAGGTEIVRDIAAVLAPTSGLLAEATIATIGERLAIAVAASSRVVVLDGGRWARSQTTARRISGCTQLLLVCQPSVAGIESARAIVDSLRAASGSPVSFLLVIEGCLSSDDEVPLEALRVAYVVFDGKHDGWVAAKVERLLAHGVTTEHDFVALDDDPHDGNLRCSVGV